MNDLLTKLLRALDAGTARRALLEQYYAGTQPLAFLSPEARTAIGNRFARIAVNVCRLTVTALTERLRVTGFAGATPALWTDWIGCNLDQLAGVAHREALTLGESYVIVWANKAGDPLVTVESATQVAVLRDPATREVVAAVKKWETESSTEVTVFEPERITRLTSSALGATTGFRTLATIRNPFGLVPVVPLRNADRLLGPAASELDDLVPLVDALNKTLADMLVSSEYAGRPRRWATGVELKEEPAVDPNTGTPTGETTLVNPYPEGSRMMLHENPETKFGQLPAADLAGYEAAVRVIVSQIMAVSALPAHYVGVLANQPASADALRAAEASLTARAEARQAAFGTAWERVAQLMVATRTGVDPLTVTVRVQWADASTRSIAQEADAVTKLHAAGLLPASYALKRLGYDEDDIEAIRIAREADSPAEPSNNQPTASGIR